METKILLLAVLVTGALAGPINVRYGNDNTMCAQKCTESSKFRYRPGMTYEFDYNVQTLTTMEGAAEEKATLGLRATAHIEILSKCELALQLRDVRVYQSDPTTAMKPVDSSEFRSALESHPLRFAFQDGVVEDLCPESGETSWALNIKRGVLSTFQNSMDSLEVAQSVHENDVTGRCMTNYKVEKSWYTTTVSKSKDLLACTDRQDFRSVLRTMPYRVPSDIQSLPLMKSEHECTQEIDQSGAYLKTALCKESHVFRPFARQQNGALTKIIQKLTYKTQRSGVSTRTGSIARRENMLFEHAKEPVSSEMKKREVERKLQEICQTSKNDIRPEVPMQFSELVYVLRNLNTAAMRDIYTQLTRGSLCRGNLERTKKIFIDSIPMVSTSSSVEMMKELLMNKEVTGLTAEMWLTTLAFIQAPTRDMLVHAKSILEMKDMEMKAMLPVSSLVNNFCSRTENCADLSEVSNIIYVFERALGRGCYVRDSNLDKVMLVIRAIGNAGNSDSIGSTALNSCFTRSSNPMEVRVAALDAFRRLPCTSDRSEPMSIFRDKSEDSELRIAAYLAVMVCPTEDVLSMVKSTLQSEEANQVGSFVWSHLSNLMETSSPHKQVVRAILEDARLKSEFNMEKLKYSRNYEASFMLDKINTGALVESNVIWSSKSFIPRSAMLNLTVDLFGNSVNLMETGGRIEGLEYLLETYLGPLGYFGEKTNKPVVKNQAKLDELRGSMYLRMFGNEMAFTHFKGLNSFPKMESYKQKDLLKMLTGDHDYSFTQNIMFLDSSIIVPTSAGMPLNLTLNGVATVDIQATGKLDLDNIFKSPMRAQIEGQVKPSGAVAITGCMTVDAFVTKAGLKMTSTLHTSTATKGRILLHGTKIVSADFDMPQDKMEILDVKTAFFVVHGDIEKEQKMITNNRKVGKVCTGSKLAKITGLEVCGEVSFPNASMMTEAPYFPFTGPVGVSLVLHKRDSHLGYRFLAKNTFTKQANLVQLAIDTPGSRVDRNLAFDFILNKAAHDVEVKMISPWKKASTKATLINTSDKKAMNGVINIDDKPWMTMDAETKIINDGQKVSYQPTITFFHPTRGTFTATGKIIREGRGCSGDITLRQPESQDTTFAWSAVNNNNEKSISMGFNYQKQGEYSSLVKLAHETGKGIKLYPTIQIKTPKASVAMMKGSCEYMAGKYLNIDTSMDSDWWMSKPVACSCKLNRIERRRNQVKYVADVDLRSKLIAVKIDGTVDQKKSGVSSRVIIDYNMPRSKKNKITFNTKYNDRTGKSLIKHTLTTNFEVKRNPEYNFDSAVDFSHNSRHTDGKLDFRVGKNPNHTLFLEASAEHKGSLKQAVANFKGKAIVPLLGVDAQLEGFHKHDTNRLGTNFNLMYTKGKSISADLKLKDDSKRTTKMGGEFSLSYPGNNVVILSGLAQASKKELEHTINVNIGKSTKHSIVTIYKRPRHESHEFSSEIRIHDMKPIRLSGETNLNLKNFKALGNVIYAGEKYGVATISKYSPSEPRGKITVDLIHPSREIGIVLDGKKSGTKYSGSLETKWDAAKDKSRRVILDGMMNLKSLQDLDGTVELKYPSRNLVLNLKHSGNKKYMSHVDFAWSPKEQIIADVTFGQNLNDISTALSLITPFDMMPRITADIAFTNDPSKYSSVNTFTWGKSGDQITSSLSLKKPVSLSNIDLSMKASTPFIGLKRLQAEIVHTIADEINTIVKGSVGSTNVQLEVTGANRGTYYKTDMSSGMIWKSNIPEFEVISINGKIINDNNQYVAELALDKNGERYMGNLDTTFFLNGIQMQSRGSLLLSSPRQRLRNSWSHRNTNSDIKSSWTSDWRGNKVYINLSGMHQMDSSRKLQGDLTIQTPWEVLRDIEMSLDHQHASGSLSSNVIIKKDRSPIATSKVIYRLTGSNGEMEILITNPYTDDLSSKANFRGESFPMTGHLEMEWSPRSRINMDGSVSFAYPLTLDGSLRFTTPFEVVRSVVIQATNKYVEGRTMESTAMVEYAPRERIELESRFRFDSLNQMNLKLRTPFTNMKAMDTMMSFAKSPSAFDSSMEIEILPILGKFSSMVNANWASDMSAKLRMDTPYSNFPYLQMEATSNLDHMGRHSHFEAEYSPRQIISAQSTYNLDGPITIDFNLNSPYQYLENVGGLIKHDATPNNIISHAEIRYSPYKTIEGDLTMKWANDVEGMLVVKTPFENYEISKLAFRQSGPIDDFTAHGEVTAMKKTVESDINVSSGRKSVAEFVFRSPFENFEEIKAKGEISGRLERAKIMGTLNYGQDEIQAVLRNSFSSRRLDTIFTLRTPFTDNLKFVIDHDGDMTRFTNKISANLGRRYTIDTDTTFDMRLPTVDLTTSLSYRLPIENRRVAFTAHKEGEWDNLNAYITGNCNGKEITVRSSLNVRNGVDGSLTIVSPYSDDIVVTMNHNGEWQHFTTKASANIGSDYIVSTDNTVHIDLPAIDISNTMLYRMNGQGRELALQTHADKQLQTWNGRVSASVDGEEYATSGMMRTSEPMEASVTIKTPISDYREVGAIVKHKGSSSRFSSSASIKYMDSQKIEGNVDFFADGMNRIDASATVTTPFVNYKRTEYKYNHNMDEKSISSHAEINYGYSQNIVADIVASMNPKSARVTITTPFEGYEMNKLILNGKGSMSDFTADGEIEFNGEKLNVDSAFSHNSATTGRFSLLATSPNVKDVVVDFTKNGDWNDFTCTCKALVGRKSVADVRVAGRFMPEQKSLSMNLKNPYTEEIEASFSHNGPMMNCQTEIKGSYGQETSVNGKMNVVSRNNYFEVVTSGNYMLVGDRDSFNANIKAQGPMSQKSVTVRCSHGDATIDGSMSYKLDRGVVVDASLSTPMENFRNLAFVLNHQGPASGFITQSSLRYMDGSEISGKMDFSNNMLSTLKTSLEVNTPFAGYESSKMSYEHSIADSSFTGNGNVEYGRGQVISAEVKLAQQPKYAVDVTVTTPFSGYESVIYSVSAGSRLSHHMADASFKMGNYNSYTMNADLNMNDSPMTGSLRMNTPLEILRNIDMTMSHSGDLKKFRSSGSMESPLTGKVTGEANMVYISPFAMDGSIILKSSLPEMEELKLAVRNSGADEKRSHIEFGWQPTKQVSLDYGYKYAKGWYNTQYNGDFSIATPFENLREVTIKSISSKEGKKYTNKMEATYNHETVLDMEGEMNTNEKCEGSLIMHKPRPVQFTWAGLLNDEVANSDIFLNWNRDEPNSNIRLLANSKLGAVKDIDVKLVHPLRTVALKGNFQNSGYQTASQGEFSWDERLGRKVFYNLDVSDNSRGYRKMYDASLTVGAPSRSVQMRGSYSDVRSTKSLNTALLWDADRDASKQIGFKGNFIPSDKSNKVDVVINMPNNLQDIKIGAEMTLDNGRTLFDGKTEFSYSPDSRKTLVLTSNLQDVSYDSQYNNYSLSLGIRHPYTDTDVEITSHIGSSSEKYASGMHMKYLTANRRRINLALLGDIDRLRKQINLQVVSPIKNIEMTGEVKSMEPYQIVVNSRVDGVPAALAAMSIDAEARSFHLESNYDLDDMSNMFHIEAKYVNDSAMQAEVYLDGRSRRTESLLSMALETPRIIQAQVHWRPEMMNDLKHYAGGQWRRLSTTMGSSLTEISDSIGQEIGQKYRVIAEATSEELKTYVVMMEREMEELERGLTRISNELRRMHYNNDYYLRSMGDTTEHYFLSALESYRQAVTDFRYKYRDMSNSLSELLEDVKSFPIRTHYTQLVDSMVEEIAMMMEGAMESWASVLGNIDEQLQVVAEKYNEQKEIVSNKISESIESINSHPHIEAIRSKLDEIRAVDYIGKMKEHLGSIEIPQEYTDAIYNAREVINNHLNEVMKRQEVKYIQDVANDVYQQGKWAYTYWRIEENIESRLREFVDLVKEIVEDEMKQFLTKFNFLTKSKVEVYQPEKGEIAVELYLPIPLSNLKEMPDTDAFVGEMKDLVEDYTPSLKSVSKMYDDYAPNIFAKSTDNNTSFQPPSMPSIRNVRQQRRGQGN